MPNVKVLKMIKVFGHNSPDTDCTGSAILYAWYLNTHTSEKAEAFVLGSLNKETQFVLKRWNIPEPTLLESVSNYDQVVIVDTNNPQELFPNITDTNILKIIEHHRLAGFETKGPIEMTLKPLASTASVIYGLVEKELDAQIKNIPENIKGIFLSCILSDTLAFRSPTTTPADKDIAENLAKELKLDLHSYADEMFAAKSDISDFTDEGLIHIDSKKSALGDKNIRISVVETTNPEMILARKESIVATIQKVLAKETDVHEILFFIIDILKEEATVLVYNDLIKQIIEKSFDVTIDGDTKVLPGVVSRKKQIIPALKF